MSGGDDHEPSAETEAETEIEAGAGVESDLEADLDRELGIDVEAVTAEEIAARRRISAIEAGRRKGGAAGAAMAGAMLAISEIYEGPKRDEIVAVSETPDEPTDIEDGIRVDVGDVSVESNPPERDQR